jgi:hypothetical protein
MTATLENGASVFSYYQSDADQGAQYETCSISGSSAHCEIAVPEYETTLSFDASYAPFTTLTPPYAEPTGMVMSSPALDSPVLPSVRRFGFRALKRLTFYL